jgi:hypothetical protein
MSTFTFADTDPQVLRGESPFPDYTNGSGHNGHDAEREPEPAASASAGQTKAAGPEPVLVTTHLNDGRKLLVGYVPAFIQRQPFRPVQDECRPSRYRSPPSLLTGQCWQASATRADHARGARPGNRAGRPPDRRH